MEKEINLNDILKDSHSLTELIRGLDAVYNCYEPAHKITLTTDPRQLLEFEELSSLPDVAVHVHPTRGIRIHLLDESDREHTMLVARKGSEYVLCDASVPCDNSQKETYNSLASIVDMFRSLIHTLQDYFDELQRIDAACWVVDPQKPTFKDNYRKIVLEERVWLYVTVTPSGVGSMRVVGAATAAAVWNERLRAGLAGWRQEASILDNICEILQIDEFPAAPSLPDDSDDESDYTCSICLCCELGRQLPQPLCSADACHSYFHVECLRQWLLSTCAIAPKLGIISGKCPCCQAPVTISELT